MEIVVFSKKATTKDGRAFTRYITRLTNKRTGEVVTMSVKFRRDCGEPDSCPCNIVIQKENVNISYRDGVDSKTGEPVQFPTLWVSDWAEGSAYVDKSTEDYF